MEVRAKEVFDIVTNFGYDKVMIGGAPYFMSYLEREGKNRGVEVLYAFSTRDVTDGDDGRKIVTFRHLGWVKA